jgi:hypothetical protein
MNAFVQAGTGLGAWFLFLNGIFLGLTAPFASIREYARLHRAGHRYAVLASGGLGISCEAMAAIALLLSGLLPLAAEFSKLALGPLGIVFVVANTPWLFSSLSGARHSERNLQEN